VRKWINKKRQISGIKWSAIKRLLNKLGESYDSLVAWTIGHVSTLVHAATVIVLVLLVIGFTAARDDLTPVVLTVVAGVASSHSPGLALADAGD